MAKFPVESLAKFNTSGLKQIGHTLAAGLKPMGRAVANARLRDHQLCVHKPTSRHLLDLRQIANVAKALPGLPADGETWHLVVKGHTPFWGFIPRLIALAEEPIAELKISTLGFGRRFAEWLLDALDSGQVGYVGLACSTYFRATSEGEYKLLADRLKPPNKLAVVRLHAKIIAARLGSGRGFVFEGSGNLRSCRMIEQCTVTQATDLCRFHQAWITELLDGPPANVCQAMQETEAGL